MQIPRTNRFSRLVPLLTAVAVAIAALCVLMPVAHAVAAAGADLNAAGERDAAELAFSFPRDATPQRLGAILRPHVDPGVLHHEVDRVMSLVEALDGEEVAQLRRQIGEDEPIFTFEMGEARGGSFTRINRRQGDVTVRVDADGMWPMTLFRALRNDVSIRQDIEMSVMSTRYAVKFEMFNEVPRELGLSCIVVASELAAIVMGVDAKEERRPIYAIVRDEDLADRTQNAESHGRDLPTTGFARRIGQETVRGGRHATIDDIMRPLRRDLDLEIIDKTDLDGHFDWEVRYQADDVESVDRALRESLGLGLVQTDKSTRRLLLSEREVRPRF